MSTSLDTKLRNAWNLLDEAGAMPPDELSFTREDETFYLSQFSDLEDCLPLCDDESKRGLLQFCEELLSMKDRRLYDFSILKTLQLEIGDQAEAHFVEDHTNENGELESVDYVIALPTSRHPTMFNCLAHEAGHNLDVSHFPKGDILREVNLHSANPLFNACFEQDCRSYPDGLGNKLDALLAERNYTHEALLANGYSEDDAVRRYQEERFAAMMELFSLGEPLPHSPLLEAYHDIIVDLDLNMGMDMTNASSIDTRREALSDALLQPVPLAEAQQLETLQQKAVGAHSQKALQPKIAQMRQNLESTLIDRMSDMREQLETRFDMPLSEPKAAQVQSHISR